MVKEATQKSFEVLVKYCEEPQYVECPHVLAILSVSRISPFNLMFLYKRCRHSVVAEYFGDPKPKVHVGCKQYWIT